MGTIQIYTNNKVVKESFVHFLFKNLRTDFNKVLYKCRVYRKEDFDESFFHNFKKEKIYDQILRNTFMFIVITSVLFHRSK